MVGPGGDGGEWREEEEGSGGFGFCKICFDFKF